MSDKKLYYMLDCHLFAPLPREVDAGMARLREVFDSGSGHYGMLCADGHDPHDIVHSRSDWAEFEPKARAWFERAVQPTAAEAEYASWFAKATAGPDDKEPSHGERP